jgi:hypothetical protein
MTPAAPLMREWSSDMSTSAPLTVDEWREFLGGFSSEFLNSDYLRQLDADPNIDVPLFLSEDQRRARWLGYESAGERAVLAVEERLGVRLPPTYRNFLLTSNGWNGIGELDLLKVDEIGWFAELGAWLLDSWSGPGLEFFAEDLERLKRCLLISGGDCGSSGYLLLHADSGDENGEWTAYEWWPGHGGRPEPHDDFAALVTSARQRLS